MDRMPKKSKYLQQELDRINRGDADQDCYTEYMLQDWAKQYHRQGDRKSEDRCQHAMMDYRRHGTKK